jgi:hypothetical protein
MSSNQDGLWVGPYDAPDRYQLKSPIGGGAEGEVWRAVVHLSAGGRSTVAVKIMPPAEGPPTDFEQRHGNLLRALAHPGLPRVTDIFTGWGPHRHGQQFNGSNRYVVMSHVEGATLREYIDDHPELKASQRLRLLRGPAAAIDALHSGAGTNVPVVHGDIKPSNIVVSEEDQTAVLVDLGLARLIDGDGRQGLTTAYAAPERRQAGSPATLGGDNYSFIVTVASTMTGRTPPVLADGFLDLHMLHAQLIDRTAVTAQRPGLVMAIMNALAAPPDARPTSLTQWMDGAAEQMTQLTDHGANALTGEIPLAATAGAYGDAGLPPVGPTPTRLEPAPPARRGNRRAAIIGAALAVVLLLVIGGFVLTRGGGSVATPAAAAVASSTTVAPTTTTVTPTTTTPSLTATTSSTGTGTAYPGQVTYLAGSEPVEHFGSSYDRPTSASTNGVAYAHAVVVSARCGEVESYVDYDLKRTTKTFNATVGLSDADNSASTGKWSILLDGVEKATGPLQLGVAMPVTLDTTGVLRVRLHIARAPISDCYATGAPTRPVDGVFGDPRTTG